MSDTFANEADRRVLIACHRADFTPTFFACTVRCTEEEFVEGEHYQLAEYAAEMVGLDLHAVVAFDEEDLPKQTFDPLFKAYCRVGLPELAIYCPEVGVETEAKPA